MSKSEMQEIRDRAAKAIPNCLRCGDKGYVSIKHGTIFITDDEDERAAAWHQEECPVCHNFNKHARAYVPALCDQLEKAMEALQVANETLRFQGGGDGRGKEHIAQAAEILREWWGGESHV